MDAILCKYIIERVTIMPQITLRVSDGTLKKLQEFADAKNLTVTDYIISQSLPNYIDEILTIDKVLDKLLLKKAGDVFSIKDLFSASEWNGSTPGSHISTGRLFFQAYEKNQFNLQSRIEFLGKNSANLAIYKKLTDN
jgi:predicted transcriptional regulator